MLEFSEGFFQDEVREDFLVDATMKAVWAAEMEVLQEIAIVADRHNLKWTAAYGTLLGAVRHGGFIPWDDDIDIMMMREDYMELLKYLPEELPNGFDVRSPMLEVEDEKEQYQTTVFNARSVSIEPERLEKFHGCPFIVGVDIFPVDYVNRDFKRMNYQINKFTVIGHAATKIRNAEDTPEMREEINLTLEAINSHMNVNLVREYTPEKDKHLVNTLWKLANDVAMENDRRSGEYAAPYGNFIKNQNIKFDKHFLEDIEYLPFEQVMMPVPKCYDKVLRAIYGDYSIIKKGGSTHDYPVYKKQLQQIRDIYNRWEEANAKDEAAIVAAKEANNS